MRQTQAARAAGAAGSQLPITHRAHVARRPAFLSPLSLSSVWAPIPLLEPATAGARAQKDKKKLGGWTEKGNITDAARSSPASFVRIAHPPPPSSASLISPVFRYVVVEVLARGCLTTPRTGMPARSRLERFRLPLLREPHALSRADLTHLLAFQFLAWGALGPCTCGVFTRTVRMAAGTLTPLVSLSRLRAMAG